MAQRRAALTVGGAFLRASAVAANGAESHTVRWIADTLADVSPRATCFGAVAGALGAGPEEAAEAEVYGVLSGMVAAAVRLRIVGPFEGQAVLRRVLAGDVLQAEEEWACFSPLLDVAAMHHELLEPRLFAS